MAFAVYVHAPFCARKCRYCDFFSVPYNTALAERYVECCIREWALQIAARFAAAGAATTIYIGGGAPSVLSEKQWRELDRRLFRNIPKEDVLEWTCEANPESFSAKKAAQWLESGVNRLSLGVQSLQDRELRAAGRGHTAAQALSTINHPLVRKFASVNVDLIYGLPGQTTKSFAVTLERLLDLPWVTHLSLYELTIASSTPFGRHARLLPLPTEETLDALDALARRAAAEHGFVQYEISNFARPGFECMHNRAYWTHQPYAGLGPSAHSFAPPKRFGNVADLSHYCDALERGKLPVAFEETIDTQMLAREMIFLRLRMNEGLDADEFASATGTPFADERRAPALRSLIKGGLVTVAGNRWKLTDNGRKAADAIARMLF